MKCSYLPTKLLNPCLIMRSSQKEKVDKKRGHRTAHISFRVTQQSIAHMIVNALYCLTFSHPPKMSPPHIEYGLHHQVQYSEYSRV